MVVEVVVGGVGAGVGMDTSVIAVGRERGGSSGGAVEVAEAV